MSRGILKFFGWEFAPSLQALEDQNPWRGMINQTTYEPLTWFNKPVMEQADTKTCLRSRSLDEDSDY
jgi:hypothetical protein